MEDLSKLKTYLLSVHPVRRSRRDKAEFRTWLLSELKRSGWRAREETYGRGNGSVNVVAGDPDRATLFFCAHYDTPSRMLVPDFVSPTNVAAHICYHLLSALVLAAAAFLLSLAVSFPLQQPGLMLPLFLALMVVLLFLAAYGPANRENANAGSGALALLAVAKALRFDNRICLVFFDNSEKNSLGAGAFRRRHPAANSCLTVYLDCVGDGEHLLLMPSKYSRWDGELLKTAEAVFTPQGALTPHILSKGLTYYPSDQRKFKYHLTVCTCRHLQGLGYYIPHLRTGRDKILSEENVAYLARHMAEFAPQYLDAAAKA